MARKRNELPQLRRHKAKNRAYFRSEDGVTTSAVGGPRRRMRPTGG